VNVTPHDDRLVPGALLHRSVSRASFTAATAVVRPHTIYASNAAEFSAPFWSLLVHVALWIVVIAAMLAVVGVLLPARFFAHYVVLLVALGVTVWAQGN